VADDTLESFAYELATAGLKSQEGVLEEVRSRAGMLFTATSVAVAFLGTQAIDRHHHRLAVIGFVAAGFALAGCVLVLLPLSELAFTLSGPATYEELVRRDADAREAKRILAYWLQDLRDDNQPKIDVLVGTFKYACWLLLLAIGLWAIQFLVGF
jgi:hypothetical protein